MLLAWNTLEEVAAYLSNNSKKWNPRQVLQTCLDHGVLVHVQLQTNTEDILLTTDPAWN